MIDRIAGSSDHQDVILDQFSRQAELFAQAPALHNDEVLSLLVEAAEPVPDDATLDVACGPGTVVAALARRVRRAVGLDATEAMLSQARVLAADRKLANVEWRLGDVYRLPFADSEFDIVSCRFAFHHLLDPAQALAEMVRVCRPGGRIVLCDGLAADDPDKAAAFNRMERHRDPSTVAFRPLSALVSLLEQSRLVMAKTLLFQVPAELERLLVSSFPVDDDRRALRQMIEDSIDGDTMAMNVRREGGKTRLAYPSAVLVANKPSS